jgi:Tc5 transposase DNA-binding domain
MSKRNKRRRATVQSYCAYMYPNEPGKWNTNLSKWGKEDAKKKIYEQAAETKYSRFKRLNINSSNKRKSPFHDMEDLLYKEIKQHRDSKRKVSRQRIIIRAKKILADIDPVRAQKFRASNGWFDRFIKRRNMKFRARKSGKQKSADDNWPAIKKWYGKLRHEILPKYKDEPCDHFSDKWGRFPPELRYNMDQVPLPFVVSMDNTYTTADDANVQIATTGKADLRKRQFTMHIYVNAGEGNNRDGYVELIGRGKVLLGTKFSKIEQAGAECSEVL